jgi:hypothetical protein
MTDITMCKGTDCPVKDACYRYTPKPSELQSYFLFPPFKGGECEMFWGEQSESIFNQLKSITNTNGESNT